MRCIGRLAGFILLSSSLLFAPPAQAQAALLGSLAAKLFAAIVQSLNTEPTRAPPPLTEVEQARGIPELASLATMAPPHGRQVWMNRKPLMLAPGAKIFDTSNRIVLPNRVQRPIDVRFAIDERGDVQTVWLLSELRYDTVAGSATDSPANLAIASTADEERGKPAK